MLSGFGVPVPEGTGAVASARAVTESIELEN